MAQNKPFHPPPYSFLHRLRCAFNGIKLAFAEGRHLRFHLFAFILVLAAAYIFDVSQAEWLALILVSGLVICLELVNSGVEKILDTLHPQFDQGIGKAKDILAGAVLAAAIIALIIGAIIFIPALIKAIYP
jgi:undecaprenol kinase